LIHIGFDVVFDRALYYESELLRATVRCYLTRRVI